MSPPLPQTRSLRQADCKAWCTMHSTCEVLAPSTNGQIGPCAHRSVGEEDARPDEDLNRLEQRIAEAVERQAAAQKQFNRLCSICIAAQQARPLCADKKPLTSHPCSCSVELSGCFSVEALQ